MPSFDSAEIGPPGPEAQFGTAHLFALLDDEDSNRLLRAASDAGFTAFDTAPSYGFGDSEAALGRLITGADPTPRVTTKVGLDPAVRPNAFARLAKAAARRLPSGWQDAVRGVRETQSSHRFATDRVRTSVDRSLRRLGRIDHLMLHEVEPDDITDDLLAVLAGYVAVGDVAAVGVATSNAATAECLRRAPDVLTAAHIAVGPFATPAELPETVTDRIGHGVFGLAGQDLARLRSVLTENPTTNQRWVEVTEGTAWAGLDGLAAALLARAARQQLTTLIVATSRTDRLTGLVRLISGQDPLPDLIAAQLDELIGCLRADQVLS